LRRPETKRRNRNGEQEEKNRSKKTVADEKSYTVAEKKGGQKNSEKAGGCQGIQTGLEEKDRQESHCQIREEGSA
jgi:hypothetical protein